MLYLFLVLFSEITGKMKEKERKGYESEFARHTNKSLKVYKPTAGILRNPKTYKSPHCLFLYFHLTLFFSLISINTHKSPRMANKAAGEGPNKKKKRKEVAIFGNYRNYYGYRVGQDLEEDPRLKVLKQEWFEGKDCLDIGCNSGSITIAIAKKFGCRSILGIDIDGDRVQDACWTLRRTARLINSQIPPKSSKLEGDLVKDDQHGVTGLQKEETSKSMGANSASEVKDLFNVVSFQKGNFVQNWRSPEDKCYHVILCLSVTKWIHLNWGDDGLITLFSKIWKLLHPGGVFIMEPQPWDSYYKNRLVSEVSQNNYRDIKIYPDGFQEILLDKIGFRKVENITSSLSGTKAGFARPIMAFWK